MISKSQINEFMSQSAIGIAGVSRNTKRFGYMVYNELKKRGLKVYPLNPNTETIDNEKCYPDVESLPTDTNAILIVTSKEKTLEILNQAIKRNIKHVWIQQGCETKEALELAGKNNINLISGQCILLAAEPVKGFHKFHKVIAQLFRLYPRN
jgi:uncharacterized protein